MIENVSTQLTVFHCFAHCLLPGRAFASLYVLLFLEKEAEIGGREIAIHISIHQFKHVLGSAQNNRLTEMGFLSTHSMFLFRKKKMVFKFAFLSVGLLHCSSWVMLILKHE